MTISLPTVKTDRPIEAVTAPAPTRAAARTEAVPAVEREARASAIEHGKAMRQQLAQALAEMNKQMQLNGRNLAFSMDEKANRTVIRVTNSVTGEVVRQIPDEVVLRIAHSIEDMKGLLHDKLS